MVFSTGTVPFYISNGAQKFPFLHIFTNTCYFLCFYSSHPDERKTHCSFDFYFPNNSDVEDHFMCFLAMCVCVCVIFFLFGEMSTQVLCSF